MKRGNLDRPPGNQPLEGCERLRWNETMPHAPYCADFAQGSERYERPPTPVWFKRTGLDKNRPVDWGSAPRGT